jgi:CsoR family transcriptional regulator, copper-sensing transcriptional repressor
MEGSRSVYHSTDGSAVKKKLAVHHARTASVINRLSRIEGHVRAIKRMIEDDVPCPDVLIQLAAVGSAVRKTARVVLEDHIDSCLTQAATDGTAARELRSLKDALDKYLV